MVAAWLSALALLLAGLPGGGATAARVDPDGAYRGRLAAGNIVDSGFIGFKVSGDGRRIGGWKVTMNVVCASLPVRVEVVTQTMPTMKVAKDGRFRSVYTGPVKDADGVRIVVSGRLNGTKVTGGKVDYRVGFRTGTCTRKASWTAARKR